MANKTQTIRIESILGGESGYLNFSAPDEYQASFGIEPDIALGGYTPSGYIVPTFVSTTTVQGALGSGFPVWIETSPKTDLYYIYSTAGSVYTNDGSSTITGIGDLNDGGDAEGNGMAYYDNYIYCARSTTVARYGPLDGTATWTDDYWVTTLSKTALSNTSYPQTSNVVIHSFNHIMLRHTDGALYFTDVVGNQGVLHKIATTKTTVEGDTDKGSTYNVVDFPYGMFPSAVASFGEQIAIALFEGRDYGTSSGGLGTTKHKAQLVLWNPSNPTTYDDITGQDFPDQIITAMVASNGVLYTFSCGSDGGTGTRVCRYLGGHSFEQVAYLDYLRAPFPGAVVASLNKISFAGTSYRNGTEGTILSIGSKLSPISNKVFNSVASPATAIFAIKKFNSGSGLADESFYFTAYDGSSRYIYNQTLPGGISNASTNSYWISQTYKIGGRFKITRISFNINDSIASGDDFAIAPSILLDDNTSSKTLQTISYTTVGSETHFVLRPENCVGKNNFNLKFSFSGSANLSGFEVGIPLPITIDYEIIDE